MSIYSAAANIEASDCCVYILQGDKNSIQITLDSQGRVHSLDTISNEATSQIASLTFVSTQNNFTLLPNLSIEQLPMIDIQSFLKWNNQPSYSITKNKLMFDNISILFQTKQAEITKSFPAAKFQHGVEILTNHSMQQQEKNSITSLLVDSQLILCVIKEGNLQLSNIFQVENNEEIIYYIMLMIQELAIDIESVDLQLFGEKDEKPFLKENLSHFVRNVTSNTHPAISNMKYSGIAKFIEQIQ